MCLLHPKSGSSRSLWAAFLFLGSIYEPGLAHQTTAARLAQEQPRILKRDGYRCYLCGAPGCRKVDHVVPVSQGGGEEDSNLAAICDDCEKRKTAREANAAKPKRARPVTERHPGLR